MVLAVVGDLHGDFAALERAMDLEPDVPAWLSVGDVASDTGEYPAPARPFYFIQGNNEDFDVLARLASAWAGSRDTLSLRPSALRPDPQGLSLPNHGAETPGVPLREAVSRPPGPANLHFVENGQLVEVVGVRVAGLGGTYAPKWYDTPPDRLPAGRDSSRRSGNAAKADLSRRSGNAAKADLSRRSGSAAKADLSRRSGSAAKADLSRRSGNAAKADKRRHFVLAQVEACLALRGVDLFLTHEAPKPYWAGAGSRRNDAGKQVINEILAAMRPRLHFFGHHHRFSESVREGVSSIGLPLAADGYVLVDTETWQWNRRAGL